MERRGLPVGSRFLPTEEEIINNYLKNKNLDKPLPYNHIPDINVTQLYNLPPSEFVENTPCTVDNEWYYFVLDDPYFCQEIEVDQQVGKEDGIWRMTKEILIADKSDKSIGFKISYEYFLGSGSNLEKSEWRLLKYRLFEKKYRLKRRSKKKSKVDKNASEGSKKGWVLARIIKGNGFERSDSLSESSENTESSDSIESLD